MPIRPRELLHDFDFSGGTVRLGPTRGQLDTSGLWRRTAREDSAPQTFRTGRNSSTSPHRTQQQKLVTNQLTCGQNCPSGAVRPGIENGINREARAMCRLVPTKYGGQVTVGSAQRFVFPSLYTSIHLTLL